MWLSHLAGMVELLKRYPRVRLAVSVRSSYEETVIPPQLSASDVVVRVTHQGFAGQEYAATKVFFRYYGITLPSVPLLNPEFENPLFLKLFCEGLRRADKWILFAVVAEEGVLRLIRQRRVRLLKCLLG